MGAKDGSQWHGWALLAGLPATIVAAGISAPVALPLLVATVVAFRHGSALEAERAAEDADQRRQEKVTARAQHLLAQRKAWDVEAEALQARYEAGHLSDDAFEAAFDALTDRYPRR